MPSITTVRSLLPPAKNTKTMVVRVQKESDMINSVLSAHKDHAREYDLIYNQFYVGDIYSTGKCIWTFLKDNLVYTAEGRSDQTEKSPTLILTPGQKVDCKHYSSFAGGVLDAIKRNTDKSFTWCYRYASYDPVDNEAAHVFVVINPDTEKEIWLDPVLNYYNEKLIPSYFTDRYTNMALYKLAGINGRNNKNKGRNGNKNINPSTGSGIGTIILWTAAIASIAVVFHHSKN